MNPWLLLFPAFLVFCGGSYCTYTKAVRDSPYYLPVFVFLALASGLLWVYASRQLDDTFKILLFSLIWDGLMVLAYYAGPLIVKGGNLSWQAWVAAGVTIVGIFWFKMAVEAKPDVAEKVHRS